MQLNLAQIRREDVEQLPSEALQVLELLEQIENHTANLRKDLISEMSSNQASIKLQLEQV
jgi:hypothetical protein